MTTVATVTGPRISEERKGEKARVILRGLGAHLVAHWNDPKADARTLAEQARQVGALVLVELEGAAVA